MRSLNSKSVKRRKVAEELLRKAFEKFTANPPSLPEPFVGPFQPPPLIIDFIIMGNTIGDNDDGDLDGIGVGNGGYPIVTGNTIIDEEESDDDPDPAI